MFLRVYGLYGRDKRMLCLFTVIILSTLALGLVSRTVSFSLVQFAYFNVVGSARTTFGCDYPARMPIFGVSVFVSALWIRFFCILRNIRRSVQFVSVSFRLWNLYLMCAYRHVCWLGRGPHVRHSSVSLYNHQKQHATSLVGDRQWGSFNSGLPRRRVFYYFWMAVYWVLVGIIYYAWAYCEAVARGSL